MPEPTIIIDVTKLNSNPEHQRLLGEFLTEYKNEIEEKYALNLNSKAATSTQNKIDVSAVTALELKKVSRAKAQVQEVIHTVNEQPFKLLQPILPMITKDGKCVFRVILNEKDKRKIYGKGADGKAIKAQELILSNGAVTLSSKIKVLKKVIVRDGTPLDEGNYSTIDKIQSEINNTDTAQGCFVDKNENKEIKAVYFDMEEIAGNNLDVLITHRKQIYAFPAKEDRYIPFLFTTDEKLRMCVGLIEDLARIHKNGIIHNDIAFRNVMVDFTQNTYKILDFGRSTNPQSLEEGIDKDFYKLFAMFKQLWGTERKCLYSKETHQLSIDNLDRAKKYAANPIEVNNDLSKAEKNELIAMLCNSNFSLGNIENISKAFDIFYEKWQARQQKDVMPIDNSHEDAHYLPELPANQSPQYIPAAKVNNDNALAPSEVSKNSPTPLTTPISHLEESVAEQSIQQESSINQLENGPLALQPVQQEETIQINDENIIAKELSPVTEHTEPEQHAHSSPIEIAIEENSRKIKLFCNNTKDSDEYQKMLQEELGLNSNDKLQLHVDISTNSSNQQTFTVSCTCSEKNSYTDKLFYQFLEKLAFARVDSQKPFTNSGLANSAQENDFFKLSYSKEHLPQLESTMAFCMALEQLQKKQLSIKTSKTLSEKQLNLLIKNTKTLIIAITDPKKNAQERVVAVQDYQTQQEQTLKNANVPISLFKAIGVVIAGALIVAFFTGIGAVVGSIFSPVGTVAAGGTGAVLGLKLTASIATSLGLTAGFALGATGSALLLNRFFRPQPSEEDKQSQQALVRQVQLILDKANNFITDSEQRLTQSNSMSAN